MYLLQAKTVDDFKNIKKRLSEKDVKSTLEGVRFLLRGDYKGKITPQIENLVDEYHELDKSGDYKTKVVFLENWGQISTFYIFAEHHLRKNYPLRNSITPYI